MNKKYTQMIGNGKKSVRVLPGFVFCVMVILASLLLSAAFTIKGVEAAATKANSANLTTENVSSRALKVSLTSIHMVDRNRGWALTANMVVKTVDGGKHWVNVSPARSLLSNMSRGFFQDALHAWIVTPSLNSSRVARGTMYVLRTMDGGIHWLTSTILDAQAVGIVGSPNFVNARQGWIEVGTGAGAGQEGVDIFSTSDGGQRWSKVSSTTPFASNTRLPLEGIKTGISFKDVWTGWATSTTNAPDHPWLYVTYDGGRTWHYQRLSLVPGLRNAFYVPSVPVFVGNNGLLPVTVSNIGIAIYGTNDGGRTWHLSTFTRFSEQVVYTLDLQNIWATDGNVIHATMNGGRNWGVFSLLSNVSAFSFVDAMHGWALSQNGAYLSRTTNGGRTWSLINYSIQ
jgi:photosystem II stability/assembly factor-like uncharacterized protein